MKYTTEPYPGFVNEVRLDAARVALRKAIDELVGQTVWQIRDGKALEWKIFDIEIVNLDTFAILENDLLSHDGCEHLNKLHGSLRSAEAALVAMQGRSNALLRKTVGPDCEEAHE